MLTRRTFLTSASAATFLASRTLLSQTTRPNIALLDRPRILAAAAEALARTAIPTLDTLTLDLPALAAANHIDPPNSARYLKAAAALVPAIATLPVIAAEPEIIARAALAEVAVALPFLQLEPAELAPLTAWFARSLAFLTEDRAALLVRDKNDYRGLAWLLQATAFARLLAPTSKDADTFLAEFRHRFKTPTLRAHLDARGFFPHDLTTPNPFRNSLFSLDLLAGCTQLLSTRFESIWDFELPEGTGTRAAIARHAPYIASPATWPYPADLTFFHDLPARRPALIFAARAYQQAEYASLWQTLTPAQPANPEILRTFPIRQPLLWLAQPRPNPTP